MRSLRNLKVFLAILGIAAGLSGTALASTPWYQIPGVSALSSTPLASLITNPQLALAPPTSLAFRAQIRLIQQWRRNECPINRAGATIYYVDNVAGADTNNGTSTSTPFATLAKAQSMEVPNCEILLKDGDVFTETWTKLFSSVNSGGTAAATFSTVGVNTISTFIEGSLTSTGNMILLTPSSQWATSTSNVTNVSTSINVTATTLWPTTGSFLLQQGASSTSWDVVTYTGTTSAGGVTTSFTGCIGFTTVALGATITQNWTPQPNVGDFVALGGSTVEYGTITAFNAATGAITVASPTGANWTGFTHSFISIVSPRALVRTCAHVTFSDYSTSGVASQKLPLITAFGARSNTETGTPTFINSLNYTAPTVTTGAGPVVVTAGTSSTVFTTPFLLAPGQTIPVETTTTGTAVGTKETVVSVTGPALGQYTVTITPPLGGTPSANDTFNSPYVYVWTLQGSNLDQHNIAWVRDYLDNSQAHVWRNMANPWTLVQGSFWQDPVTKILYIWPWSNIAKFSTNIEPVYSNDMAGLFSQNFDDGAFNDISTAGFGMSINITFGTNSAFQGQNEAPYTCQCYAAGTNALVISNCEFTYTYNHCIGLLSQSGTSGGIATIIGCRYGFGVAGSDIVDDPGGSAKSTFQGDELWVFGAVNLGCPLPQGIQPYLRLGTGSPAIGHTSNAGTTTSTVAISSYVATGTTATFTTATLPSVNTDYTVGSAIQLTGTTTEYATVTSLTGTGPYSWAVVSNGGATMGAAHSTMGSGAFNSIHVMSYLQDIYNEPGVWTNTGFTTTFQTQTWQFPIFSGGSGSSPYLTQDYANYVMLPFGGFVNGEPLWAEGGTEELLYVIGYTASTGQVILSQTPGGSAGTNGTAHARLVSPQRCRAFLVNCSHYSSAVNGIIKNHQNAGIVSTSAGDTTIQLNGTALAAGASGLSTSTFQTSTAVPYVGEQLTSITHNIGQTAYVISVGSSSPYLVTLSSALSATIVNGDSFVPFPTSSQGPQASQWFTGDAGPGSEALQCKSYNASTGVITLADGTGVLRTTTVQFPAHTSIGWDAGLSNSQNNNTSIYMGNPGGMAIGCYEEANIPFSATTSPPSLWPLAANSSNVATVDGAGNHNGGGMHYINCVFKGDAGTVPVGATQTNISWFSDTNHNTMMRFFNCRFDTTAGPKTAVSFDGQAGNVSTPTGNNDGVFNTIWSAAIQGAGGATSLTNNGNGFLSVGIGNGAGSGSTTAGNTTQLQKSNVYCGVGLNSTFWAGVAGASNDATGVLLGQRPPLWYYPEAGSPLITTSSAAFQLYEGNPIQYDYFGVPRSSDPNVMTLGPIEGRKNQSGIPKRSLH